ncbi:MAG TPA: hypothetical protein VGN97_11000 [Mesorhizobium sp.]|nr:hypothetical protein [Mesorhizobium sp.]
MTGKLFPLVSALCASLTSAAFGQNGSDTHTSPSEGPRVVHADVVALDHLIVYNRFGSFDPHGMIFALRRDVSSTSEVPRRPDAAYCSGRLGIEAGKGELQAGKVRLKDCKRPRPLVLRARAGDILEITVTNLLREQQPDFSQTFCKDIRPSDKAKTPVPADIRAAAAQSCREHRPSSADEAETNWPATRQLSFVIPGLEPVPDDSGTVDLRCLGTDAVNPGTVRSGTFTCRWHLDREGTHLFSSLAAPAGGQGDGGSLSHGLYGALIVEPRGSEFFRSQVTSAAFNESWAPKVEGQLGYAQHAREGDLALGSTKSGAPYEDVRSHDGMPKLDCRKGVPVLIMLRPCETERDIKGTTLPVYELVHADLNAIIVPGSEAKGEAAKPFREFTVIFQDELKTFYTDEFRELERFGQLSGVRDAFGINYGASGAGSIVIANRKGIGPTANCVECLYEEFFLQSWANGDPALLEAYPDDPSNVHHSYLNDKVIFRNLHAGPKETHVFHLHTHQWFAGNDENRGSYLDSQTIAPMQGFTYRIYHGGLRHFAGGGKATGWWESLGAGNRNRTPGDAIFHCHLYPHFAQGMWALWRVHDVLEDGTRLLPDGHPKAELTTTPLASGKRGARDGSVDPETGKHLGPKAEGTPIPGLIPLPDRGAPLLPTYDAHQGMPGYPFYVAGRPGHRAPQPPLDMALDEAGKPMDGGLPRHIVLDGKRKPAGSTIAEALAIGDMTAELEELELELLPPGGTRLERRAMAFHHDGQAESGGQLVLREATGKPITGAGTGPDASHTDAGSYKTVHVDRTGLVTESASLFSVNGAPAAPGAPFADPCGAPEGLTAQRWPDGSLRTRQLPSIFDPFDGGASGSRDATPVMHPDPGLVGFRRFEVSAIQLDTVVNRAGWHDPQTRMNRLSADVHGWKGAKRADAEPFFFRGFSGECVEFRHTNETPKDLELDDFQLRVPTDTIGQHIHLVKFDVTSADGSGNGFNYEDGTFAPDEILARICAATGGDPEGERVTTRPGESVDTTLGERLAECEALRKAKASDDPRRAMEAIALWKRNRVDEQGELTSDAKYFQTTVQRWFADPILSETSLAAGQGGGGGAAVSAMLDRTMRTVFTHDHFAPSNIQQHGFYSALLVEPNHKQFCVQASAEGGPVEHTCQPTPDGTATVTIALDDGQRQKDSQRRPLDPPIYLAEGDRRSVGPQGSILSPQPVANLDAIHPDQREFALAIADFALLYDGKPDPVLRVQSSPKGLERLVAEAEGRRSSDEEDDDGEVPPASEHALSEEQKVALRAHAEEWRAAHGRPVAPPPRPEAISQKHHDPYLINYRLEAIPLRVGSNDSERPFVDPDRPCRTTAPAEEAARNLKRQRDGEDGNLANVFRTETHGDPCTPVLDAIQGDLVSFRLIQGAHEVQHMFTVEGRPFWRNGDQDFPSSYLRSGGEVPQVVQQQGRLSHWHRCQELALGGMPLQYDAWLTSSSLPPNAAAFFDRHQELLEGCDNIEGYVASQEVGISEHFEMAAAFRADIAAIRNLAKTEAIETIQPVAGSLALAPGVLPRATDYLYHFGTHDALWNGAWGLLRVHEAPPPHSVRAPGTTPGTAEGPYILNTPDLTSCLGERNALTACLADASFPIGRRLPRLRSGSERAQDNKAVPANALTPFQANIPSAACPPSAPQTIGAIAAVQARDVFSTLRGMSGTIYDPAGGLFDPDGLMFVAVDPDELGLTPNDFLWPGAKPAIDPADIRKAALRSVQTSLRSGQHPLTLRVNAGDCLRLAVVNGLRAEEAVLLPDRPGDALMPQIVPLNVDQSHRGGGADDLRPSDRIAVIVPTSVVSPAQAIPAPFGVNAGEAIAPTGGSTPNWYLLEIYAGRLWIGDNIDDVIAALVIEVPFDPTLRAKVRLTSLPTQASSCTDPRAAINYSPIIVLGRRFCLSDITGVDDRAFLLKFADTNTSLRANFTRATSAALRPGPNKADPLQGQIHEIPYAFGPLPIKSLGDPISHASHGLLGTLIVEPEGARYDGRPRDPSADETLNITAVPPLPSAIVTVPDICKVAPGQHQRPRTCQAETTFQEHTLVWQDGLNLWDAAKAPLLPPRFGPAIPVGAPVPDCRVCDDSYDRGEKGVSYRSANFINRLRGTDQEIPTDLGLRPQDENRDQSTVDLNAFEFPQRFFHPDFKTIPTPVLALEPGGETLIRVVHPQGRARQRAFVPLGSDYEDIFLGFGSGHSALLAPGKGITAASCAPQEVGKYLWFDGARHVFAGGAWGVFDVKEGDAKPQQAQEEALRVTTACDRRPDWQQ